jgi:glyoxylase I family protein
MSQLAFAHVGLTCNDPIAVEAFYTKHFGFKRVRVVHLGDQQIVYVRSGDLSLEIFKAAADRPVPQADKDGPAYAGWRHIAFQVDDLDAKLANMGGDAKVTLGPLDFNEFIPGWKTAWVADPEGNIIEISQGYVDQDPPPESLKTV